MPPDVAALAERYPPWRLYRLETGERCFVGAACQMADGPPLLRVYVTVGLNPILAEDDDRLVDPAELTLCEASDLPETAPQNDTTQG
jgi:hypothetical protein